MAQLTHRLTGQNHDRLQLDQLPLPVIPTNHPGIEDDVPPAMDITASQKMLSAMSGSLLTSLLGNLTRSAQPAYGLLLSSSRDLIILQ